MKSDQELNGRVKRELVSHSRHDVLSESYRLKNRFAHIWTYPSRQRIDEVMEKTVENLSGNLILDYGCGRGQATLEYLHLGADVIGIDLSPTYLKDANLRLEAAGNFKGRFGFCAMDAHNLAFADNSFTLIIGEGILHHLDAGIALKEIWRVLKPNGRVLLREPLADNPLLKLFRLLTPNARTEDEAPFSGKDIAFLTRNRMWQANMLYCGVMEAAVAIFTSLVRPSRPQNSLLAVADIIEQWLHEHGLLLSYNQYVLINLTKVGGEISPVL